jgi:probable rRNA maturation factor
MMDLTVTIEVNLTSGIWREVCPAAERLARDAAGLALMHGMSASAYGWHGPSEISITLADAEVLQRLNRDYRGRDVPTNVLAFPAWEPGTAVPPGAPLLLGDVVLAFETTAQEASEQNKPITDHLGHLVVHGVLHLFGYDHRTRAEAAEMEALEASILAKLGVPDPYRETMSLIKPELA